MREEALAAARQSEARWQQGRPLSPIDGVPTSVKDLVLARGWPTLRGSKTVDPAGPWDQDAPSVARLREAGAVLVGRTTTPEFGWKGVTDSALTGITRNPWDPTKTPGGSSGGAAVAAATGMAALNIGTDGGGSIRIPAGFTGIFGLKPSFGRVPAYPLEPVRHRLASRPDDPHGARRGADAVGDGPARPARLDRPALPGDRFHRRAGGRRPRPAHRLSPRPWTTRRSTPRSRPRWRRRWRSSPASAPGSRR